MIRKAIMGCAHRNAIRLILVATLGGVGGAMQVSRSAAAEPSERLGLELVPRSSLFVLSVRPAEIAANEDLRELAQLADQMVPPLKETNTSVRDIRELMIIAYGTPPEPATPPEGTSVLGDSGAGIRWYVCDDVVLGYVSRRRDGCYRVLMREAVPSLKTSWDLQEPEAARQPDTDHLLHQTGTRELPASPDHRALTEPDAAERQGRESKGRSAQQSTNAERLVTVHVLGTSAAEKSPGVAAGS